MFSEVDDFEFSFLKTPSWVVRKPSQILFSVSFPCEIDMYALSPRLQYKCKSGIREDQNICYLVLSLLFLSFLELLCLKFLTVFDSLFLSTA